MVDVEFLKNLLKQTSGDINYLTKDVTILKLVDSNPLFVKHYKHYYGNAQTLCRKVLGIDEPCVGCALANATLKKNMLMFGVEIGTPIELKVFSVPLSVTRQIVNLLLTDDWKSLVDQESELIVIKKEGQGLATRYNVSVTKKRYKHDIDVTKLDLNQYMKVPSLEAQCDDLQLGADGEIILAKLQGKKVAEDDEIPF